MSEAQSTYHEEVLATKKGVVKLAMNIHSGVYADLKELAERRNTSITQVVRSSISNERFFIEEIENGSKILIDQGGEIREVVFLPEI